MWIKPVERMMPAAKLFKMINKVVLGCKKVLCFKQYGKRIPAKLRIKIEKIEAIRRILEESIFFFFKEDFFF